MRQFKLLEETDVTRTTQETFLDLTTALQNLANILGPALSARYEAPPKSGGGTNPTMDITLNPRRLALSDEIRSAEVSMRRMSEWARRHHAEITYALETWQGVEREDRNESN